METRSIEKKQLNLVNQETNRTPFQGYMGHCSHKFEMKTEGEVTKKQQNQFEK